MSVYTGIPNFLYTENELNVRILAAAMNGKEIGGKRLKVEIKKDKGDDSGDYGGGHNGPANLFIMYLPEAWTEDDLKTQFASYGTIVSATIMSVSNITTITTILLSPNTFRGDKGERESYYWYLLLPRQKCEDDDSS